MTTEDAVDEAVDVLQQLGLKEYEAKCFVGLSRLSAGTAKQLGEITDVPRTRVYDAIRVLEMQGLVEVQHSSPQQFRAVPLEEAVETLRGQYEDRIDRLVDRLEGIEQVQPTEEGPVQEVWSLTGSSAIETRTEQLIDEATEELVLVVGNEALLSEALVAKLNGVAPGVSVFLGAPSNELRTRIEERVPGAQTFVSGLEWLRSETESSGPDVGHLLLVDRSTILVSSILLETGEEHAVFGRGFGNGLVVILRRLMSQGLGEAGPSKS